MTIDSLGDRMKEYETVTKNKLVRRMPAILRLDGRSFHTFTRSMTRPFDETFTELMMETTSQLLHGVQTAVFAYSQSDEISLLLKDYSKLETQAWFGGQIQKIVSISAAIATAHFNRTIQKRQYTYADEKPAMFDARVFNVPKEDVVNYFIWRQQDATRNSINALGQAHFSHKELQNKNINEVQTMLDQKGIYWQQLPTKYKRGFCTHIGIKEVSLQGVKATPIQLTDLKIPIFTENREYISRFLESEV